MVSTNKLAVDINLCNLVNCTEMENHSATVKIIGQNKSAAIHKIFVMAQHFANTGQRSFGRKRNNYIRIKRCVKALVFTKRNLPSSVKGHIAVTNKLRSRILAERAIFV